MLLPLSQLYKQKFAMYKGRVLNYSSVFTGGLRESDARGAAKPLNLTDRSELSLVFRGRERQPKCLRQREI